MATTQIHTSAAMNEKQDGQKKWPSYNKKIFPPQTPDEERRPAVSFDTIHPISKHFHLRFLWSLQYICHVKQNIHYSPFKMWYVASFIRGMTIDEALRQLSFCHKKGASFVRDTILEAQELAVKQHNVEFKTNLWIG